MGITPQQFEQLKTRVGSQRTPSPAVEAFPRTQSRGNQIIIGIDPSLRGTGYGVIRLAKPHPIAITHGTIKNPPGWERSRCLVAILQTLREVLTKSHPTVCAVESLFYAQNLQTTLIMGEARGAALAAIAEAGLEIYELAPRKVKQAIVGYGAAQKTAVAKMVQRILHLPEPPAPDAADALAIALAFAQQSTSFSVSAPKRI
jgi:crossover junction endodeoxyribonuclease RuvC